MLYDKIVHWAEYDRATSRLTGNYRIATNSLPMDKSQWVQLTIIDAMNLITGGKKWKNMLKIADRVLEMPADVDVRFLNYISAETWPTLNLIHRQWTNVPYVPLDVPKIEPDDWDLFWKLWNERSSDISRDNVDEPQFWKGLICWVNPKSDPKNYVYSNTVIDDWSMHFPKMFRAIHDSMPFHYIEKIVLWSNVNEVTPHFDPDHEIYPFPDSLRIMLHDTNERSTFWMSKWPQRSDRFKIPIITKRNEPGAIYGVRPNLIKPADRIYVNIPKDTNSFVFNNGAFLHGADLAKPKIIMAVRGRPKIYDWLNKLELGYSKYKDNLNYVIPD